MTIKEIRQITHLSQSAFAEKYNIPKRSIENWELPEGNPNHRECPEYVASMLEDKVSHDYGYKISIDIETMMMYEKMSNGDLKKFVYLIKRHAGKVENMTKELSISILMEDGHTKREAEKALANGTTVYTYDEFMIFTVNEIPFADDDEKQDFISRLEADKATDHRNLTYNGQRYIIEYVL